MGWRLVDGQLERRGEEAFEVSVDMARGLLEAAGLPTAKTELHEAMRDLARRPDPDLTGAVHHAMAALECTAREAVGDRKATLGEILRWHPQLLPKPLDEGLIKLWGYSSNAARHIQEGATPGPLEAALVVGVAAAVCSHLAQQLQAGRA